MSQKETKNYSRALSSDEEKSIKRFKNNKDRSNQSYSTSIANSEENIWAKSREGSLVQNNNDIGGVKSVRTNLILERLRRNGNTTSDQSSHHRVDKSINQNSNPVGMNMAQEQFLHTTNDQCRKNVICERLKRHNVKSVPTCPNSLKENRDTMNSNDSKPAHLERNEESQLKQVTTCRKPAALPRQFPGPAGLLPHLSGGIIPPSIPESLFSDNSDSTKTDVIDNTSIIPRYCSRNTTSSSSDSPWQLLLSDLRPGFLDGHEISTVKQRILANSFETERVPILAGIVQRVDYTRLDPSVVLKDSTGTIEGTVCNDILIEYPHFLDIGVVLFLGNVGFLTIGSYPKKCHVILTSRNIINIYTCKCRILSISEMEARLHNLNSRDHLREFVNQELLNPGSSNSEFECRLPIEYVRATKIDEAPLRLSHSESSEEKASRTSIRETKNLLEHNDNNSASFQYNTNPFQSPDRANNRFSFESRDLQDFDDNFTASFLDLRDDPAFEAATNVDQIIESRLGAHASVLMNENIVVCTKNSTLNTSHPNLELPQKIKLPIPEASNMRNESTKMFEATCQKEVTANSVTIGKSNLIRTSDTKLKLSIFKSNEELTPQPSEDPDLPSGTETCKQNKSSFASGLLSNVENYSDEELFSQLDVESIVSNYNRLNDAN